jgi:C4-dicarboxylate-specific signal transduction histidine kinase
VTANEKCAPPGSAKGVAGLIAVLQGRLLCLVLSPTSFAETARKHRVASVLLRYGLAVLTVLLALGLTLALSQFVARPNVFLFFVAIVAVAWLSGPGPSVLAALISVPGCLYFYRDGIEALIFAPEGGAVLTYCMICALAGSILSHRQRRADQILQTAHQELAAKASELQRANNALVAQIAEREQTERALRDAQSELTRVAKLTTMGELAASMAHELNQPLAAVVTSAGSCVRWLEGDDPNLEFARRAAARIVRDGNRASEVVGRIRAAVGKTPPETSDLDVNATIENVLSLIQPDLEKDGVQPELRLAKNLPHVVGDRVQLQQVFVNLAMNAIEAMSEVAWRPRRLTIETESRTNSVLITVRDTGDGLKTDNVDRLFDPFVTTKPLGMGLGLSICRSIIEAHGGTLRASPAMPHGATFQVILPAAGGGQ